MVWVDLHEDEMQLNSYALTLGQKTVAGSYSGSFHDLGRAAKLLAAEEAVRCVNGKPPHYRIV